MDILEKSCGSCLRLAAELMMAYRGPKQEHIRVGTNCIGTRTIFLLGL